MLWLSQEYPRVLKVRLTAMPPEQARSDAICVQFFDGSSVLLFEQPRHGSAKLCRGIGERPVEALGHLPAGAQ